MDGALIEKIVDQGGLFAIMVFGMWLAARLAWWAAKRLLDPEKADKPGGLLVQWFKAHQEFLDGLASRDEQQQKVCVQHVALMHRIQGDAEEGVLVAKEAASDVRELVTMAKGKHSPLSTAHFNDSVADFARIERLKLSIRSGMDEKETERVRSNVVTLLHTIESRHTAVASRSVEK